MTKALRILALLLVASPAFAQVPRTYSQPELEQMLAPIALYPDAMLSQVLMAATYPVDLIQAARWSRANPGLQGDDAVRAVAGEAWDASVKSLLAFPHLLARMDEQLDWLRMLGEAFVAQEPQVMDTVQELRRRAQAAGNLQSGEQMTVQQQGPAIVLQPASPQYVYVPYYDPMVVYGTWWRPAYRPVYWAPWPGYARPYHPGVSFSFWWGQPVGLSSNFFFGNFDWQQRHVRVVHPSAYYYRPPVIVNRTVVIDRGRWQREPRGDERIVERRPDPVRVQVQAQPREIRQVQSPTQPPVRTLPVVERREHRHEVREPVRIERREVRQELRTAAAPIQAAPRVQIHPQPSQQPQARMPAAAAPQQPRAHRHEAPHVEPRNEQRGGGRQRS